MTRKRMVAVSLIAVLAAVSIGWAVVSSPERRVYRSTSFIMDTFVELCFYGGNAQEAADALEERLRAYDKDVSLYSKGSAIAALSDGAGTGLPVPVRDDVLSLLEKAKQYSLESGGAFDMTIAPLTLLWGVTSGEPHVPGQREIGQALSLVDARDLILDRRDSTALLLRAGQAVDLGGIAKGAASELVFEVMDTYGVKNGYASLGGNMAVRGHNPHKGKDFLFGVRDPRGGGGEIIGTLPLEGMTMATTGDYERFFESGGIRYHHVLDPRTGYPARGGLISVSVISADGALADFLSTALFVLGKETALSQMDQESFSLIAVDEELNVYVSCGLEGVFKPNPEKAQYRFYFQ